MKEWWRKKKSKMRRDRKSNEEYGTWDFIFDVLFWVPELIIFPFRLMFWMLRGVGRLLTDIF